MANMSPPLKVVKGGLKTTLSLVEHRGSSEQWEPVRQEGLSITSTVKEPPADILRKGYVAREFQIEARAKGRYDVDFELKDRSTGNVRCSVRNTLIFKSKFWPF